MSLRTPALSVGERVDDVLSPLSRLTVRHRLGLCGYGVAYGTAALLAFRFPRLAPPFGVFLLLVALYLLPIGLALDDLPVAVGRLLLLATTALPVLIVVDPVETGLFGYDAYVLLADAELFRRHALTVRELVLATDERPLFFPFVEAVFVTARLLVVDLFAVADALDLATVAKYVPLLTVVAPQLYYLALSRLAAPRPALVAAFGFASVRSLLFVETKFVNETLALFLFLALLALLTRDDDGAVTTVAVGLTGVALAATHHLSATMASLLLVVWVGTALAAGDGPALPGALDRVVPEAPRRSRRLRNLVVAAVAVVEVNALFWWVFQPGSARALVRATVRALLAGGTVAPAAGRFGTSVGGQGSLVRTLLASYGSAVLLVLFAAVCATVVLSRYRNESWETAWVVYGGLVSVLYVAFLLGGRLVWLDPARLLIFLVPFLLGVAVHALGREDFPLAVRAVSGRTLAAVLVAAFVVTQLAALPSYVLYSEPSVSVVGESHNSPQHFAAGEWLARHGDRPVVGWDSTVWRDVHGNRYVSYSEFDGRCDGGRYLAWRAGAERSLGVPERAVTGDRSVVYDSGDVSLTYCTGFAPVADA